MPPSLQELLAPYPIISTLPVQWGEMDSARHVNNVVYIRWLETARIDYFARLGFDDFSGKEIGPILGSVFCKYIFPLTFPDTVWMGTRAKDFKEDRFTMETAIFSEQHGRIAALADAVIIPYNYRLLQKAGIPENLMANIQQLEATHSGK